MALFGQNKEEDVAALIAKKNYAKAIEVIRAQLQQKRDDPRVRMQLADVLVLAGKGSQAIAILGPLSDEFAREGFAAKAISVLKKIEKIEPGRRDVEVKLASLIQEKQRLAVAPAPSSPSLEIGMEMGMEEIGIAAPSPAPVRLPPAMEPEPEPAPAEAPPPRQAAPTPPARPAIPAPVVDMDLEESGEFLELEPEPEPVPAAAPEAEPVPELSLEPEPELSLEPEADLDLEPEGAEELNLDLESEGAEAAIEPEPVVEPEAEAANPLADSGFASDLLSAIDDVFQDLTSAPAQAAPEAAPAAAGGSQIVVSPLFKDFSVDEMVAVIQGLSLHTFERGAVIIKEGQKGNSLYMLTSGTVRAFVKKDGKNVKVGDLAEGAFFGEVSMLTGKPRTATVAALTHCELLELDRPTLDSIAKTHPHVMDVLREFSTQRLKNSG